MMNSLSDDLREASRSATIMGGEYSECYEWADSMDAAASYIECVDLQLTDAKSEIERLAAENAELRKRAVPDDYRVQCVVHESDCWEIVHTVGPSNPHEPKWYVHVIELIGEIAGPFETLDAAVASDAAEEAASDAD